MKNTKLYQTLLSLVGKFYSGTDSEITIRLATVTMITCIGIAALCLLLN